MKNIFSAIVVALVLVGCNGVPDTYQGVFQDKAKGIKLTLEYSTAQIEFRNGRKVREQPKEIKFDAMADGKPGVFIDTHGDDEGVMDIYWVNPKLDSRKKENNFVWFDAEIIYTQADARKKAPVKQIQMVHCTDGMVMLDLPSKRFQLGCPAGPTIYNTVRIKDREKLDPFKNGN